MPFCSRAISNCYVGALGDKWSLMSKIQSFAEIIDFFFLFSGSVLEATIIRQII